MKVLLVLATAIGIFGCARQSELIWDKPGATQAEYDQDHYACLRESRVQITRSYTPPADTPPSSRPATFAGGFADGLRKGTAMGGGYSRSYVTTDKPLYIACMRAHGWTAREAE